jgi:hypothetical protein
MTTTSILSQSCTDSGHHIAMANKMFLMAFWISSIILLLAFPTFHIVPFISCLIFFLIAFWSLLFVHHSVAHLPFPSSLSFKLKQFSHPILTFLSPIISFPHISRIPFPLFFICLSHFPSSPCLLAIVHWAFPELQSNWPLLTCRFFNGPLGNKNKQISQLRSFLILAHCFCRWLRFLTNCVGLYEDPKLTNAAIYRHCSV